MESFSYLIVGILAILCGIVTGLIPGIHINMISTFILLNASFLFNFLSLDMLIVFIIVMSLTHTFVDFIPSVVFGVPDADTALSVLPAHKMVHEGRAFEAIFISAAGSFAGIFGAIFVGGVFFFILNEVYTSLKALIPYVLMVVMFTLIFMESDNNKRFWAFLITLFSGGYGLLILNSEVIREPLLVMFTGLFGISTILLSLKDKQSKPIRQKFSRKTKVFSRNFLRDVSLGTMCASLCSIMPGIGNAQAGTLAASIVKEIEKESFIIVLSVINTVNFAVSIVTFYLIDRARNGSISVISQLVNSISVKQICTYFAIMIIVGIIVFFITIHLGKVIIEIIEKVNIRKINLSILIFLLVFISYVTGIKGLVATLGATSLGILCISLEIRRVHLMSVLIVPVIFNLI